ncbi:hypothetical protein F0562_014468 [Nyssa sinensis]|uniref:Uncharacterized protein n=1 Tax=Nyssa sinensis TaxID=561372 RepID=A0A5J4ZRZ9_9ASTE|nr:hypothetical protein F0562_014468 [Nyssa sinensis]
MASTEDYPLCFLSGVCNSLFMKSYFFCSPDLLVILKMALIKDNPLCLFSIRNSQFIIYEKSFGDQGWCCFSFLSPEFLSCFCYAGTLNL